MQGYVLSPYLRRGVGFCFTSTFVVIAGCLALFLFFIAGVIGGFLEQDARRLEPVAYVAVSLIFAFEVVMAMYAVGYVVHLWKKGLQREALRALVTLVFLNILAGYIWFYMSEIKGPRIQPKLM